MPSTRVLQSFITLFLLLLASLAPVSDAARTRRSSPRGSSGSLGPSSGSDVVYSRLQTELAINRLNEVSSGLIYSTNYTLSEVRARLRIRLKLRRHDPRVRVTTIQYYGANGDIATFSSVIQELLADNHMFDLEHAIFWPESYRRFVPDYLVQRFHNDNANWGPPVSVEADCVAFVERIKAVLAAHPPDILINANYRKSDFRHCSNVDELDALIAPRSDRITADITSYNLPRKNAKLIVGPKHIKIVAQQPEFWSWPESLKMGGPFVGRFATMHASTNGSNSGRVYEWLGLQKQRGRRVMYLGLGAVQRDEEKSAPTHPLYQFARERIQRQPADEPWSFIVLHNTKREGATQAETSDSGRIFHLFYGDTSFINLWPHVDLTLTHSGVGSVTDGILARTPSIAMPLAYGAADQKIFASKAIHWGIGTSVLPVTRDEVRGVSQYPVEQIHQAFEEAIGTKQDPGKLAEWRRNIEPRRSQIIRSRGVQNALELLIRMMHGWERSRSMH